MARMKLNNKIPNIETYIQVYLIHELKLLIDLANSHSVMNRMSWIGSSGYKELIQRLKIEIEQNIALYEENLT